MSRFTNETLENAIKTYKTLVEACDGVGDDDYCPILDKVTVELLEELKEYRHLEEQGLLLKLPCKVGDTAYYVHKEYLENVDKWINTIDEVEVSSFVININLFVNVSLRIGSDVFGRTLTPYKTLFFTKAEAEKALAEMKGEWHGRS